MELPHAYSTPLDLDRLSKLVGNNDLGESLARAITDARQFHELLPTISHISTAGRGEGAGDLAALSKKATQGEWHVESERTDGSYGSGEDCSEGYHTAVICTDEIRHGKPGVIFEGSNSTIAEIEEEGHEDGFHAWDAVSKANAEFIVALVNAFRSGRLVERSAADATNPQDQE
ncbi:hypothetical protein NS229_14790 [Methylobacterium indicum]|nr:hypothetical protein NS229_14790 [Methylobacterium indicum]